MTPTDHKIALIEAEIIKVDCARKAFDDCSCVESISVHEISKGLIFTMYYKVALEAELKRLRGSDG